MTDQRFVLRTREVARNARAAIAALFPSDGEPEAVMEMVLRPYKKDRSLSQNRLSHMWYGQRAKQQGTTPEYEHQLCKLRYGCPLLIAADSDFAEIYRRAIEPLDYEQRIAAMKYLPVTRLFNVSQMTEYLNTVEHETHAQGMSLTHPEDLYWEAMGR